MSAQQGENYLYPKEATPLAQDLQFAGARFTVGDFWTWAFSDLRENITRGILAEFLVAKAVGDPSPLRHAWDNFDVTTPSGVRVEVKSSAYLQSWRQRELSKITFTGLTGRAYSYESNEMAEERSLRADVYVFALHSCQEPDQYDALDTSAWHFYVVPVQVLRDNGSRRSVSKAFLDRLGVPHVSYDALAKAVEAAATT